MRVAINILLFILFFVAPFAMGLHLMNTPLKWLAPESDPVAAPPRIGNTGEIEHQTDRKAAAGVSAPETARDQAQAQEPAQAVPLQQSTVADDDEPAARDEIAEEPRSQKPRLVIQIDPELNTEEPADTDGDDIGMEETEVVEIEPNTQETVEVDGDVVIDVDIDADVAEATFETTSPDAFSKHLRRPTARKYRPLEENPRFFQYALRTRADFDQLARRDNVPGALGVRELKVLIAGADTDSPAGFFMNTGRFPYHYCFVRDLLHPGLSHSVYKDATYYKQAGRKFLAASLVAHDNFKNPDGTVGAYIISFWPTDPVNFKYVSMAYDVIIDSMDFDHGPVYFQPSGTMQEELYEEEKSQFAAAGVPVMLAQDFYSNFSFSPLNTGTSYGRLLMTDGTTTYSSRDIVVFKNLPNDLSVAAGIITEAPQTPLSHVNLKAQQNGIPNAYVQSATTNETLTSLAGEYVRYEVTSDGWRVTKATNDEVMAFVEASRPPASPPPVSNLKITSIMPLSAIGFHDADAFGAKAANVGELGKILHPGTSPTGYAVPFFVYDEFMKTNGLYEEAQAMMAAPDFREDAGIRRERLKAFREKIQSSEAPEWMLLKLGVLQKAFPPGTNIRCRSSTNNEDIEGFNGAGLYDSCTHRADEGHLIKSMKQVWASLWTFRAFEEREFYRVDHMKVYMGVLAHPNFDDELANGVGITRNIFDPRWLGFYVNVQIGENLITNPEEESIPEEFLVSVMTGGPQDQAYSLEIQYARRSNKVAKGETVLTREQAVELARNMRTIHRHFRELYQSQDDSFAMDIEFKIDTDGKLVIKQARPWVWPNLPAAEDTDC
ncbi:MAG: hypothetical protein O3C21_12020 [Verrucomicrobia bacterium]|nr:hypothetical protein [Verrucomicrobiota bacterium]